MTTDTQNTPTKEEQDALMAAHSVAVAMAGRGDRLFFLALETVLCGAWANETKLTRKEWAQNAIDLLKLYVGEE